MSDESPAVEFHQALSTILGVESHDPAAQVEAARQLAERAARMESAARSALLHSAITATGRFHRPDQVLRLLSLPDAVRIDLDAGTVAGLEPALDAFARANPHFLAAPPEPPAPKGLQVGGLTRQSPAAGNGDMLLSMIGGRG